MPENRHPYDPSPTPFLENQGWKQMQLLLNKHLPSEAPVPQLRPLAWQATAACLIASLAFPALLKDNAFHQASSYPPHNAGNRMRAANRLSAASHHTAATAVHLSANPLRTVLAYRTMANTVQQDAIPSSNRGFTGSTIQLPNKNAALASLPGAGISIPADTLTSLTIAPVTTQPPETAQVTGFYPQAPTRQPDPASPNNTMTPVVKKNTRKPLVSLGVQLSRNLYGHVRQGPASLYRLPVYPGFTASVLLNPRLGFTTGISAFTPGRLGNNASANQTMVMNRTASLGVVNGRETIEQVYYWQVPLTIDLPVKKHLILSAGASMAFLQKVLVSRQETAYNYTSTAPGNNTASTINTSRLLSANAADRSSVGQSYNIRRFDPRLLLGVQYHTGRWKMGLQYAHAFTPSVADKYQAGQYNRNQVLNLTAGFDLWKEKK